MNENSDTPDWEPDTRGVTKVVFDASFASARPTSTYGWFTNMAQLTTITNLEYLNTSEVDDMSQMFYGCESLVSLDLSHFNTSKVTEMWMMFYECTSLKSLDLTSFNTKKVIVMNEMFSGCTSLNSIDLSSFYTSQTRYMDEMFVNCTSLTTISVGDGWDASHASTDNMFYHCYNIVGELGTTYNSVYDEHVGEDAAHIDWETYPGYFVGPNYLKVPYALLSADGKTLIFYNDGQRATRRMYKTYSTDMATNEEPGWFNDESCWEITHAVFDQSFANARPESTYYWFAQMHKLASIEGMEYLNTSEVISMEGMFEECEALTSLDVSNFDTRNVIIMSGLFNDCCELTTLDVSNFDTRNVTSMYNMFNWCSGLTELDLSNFDTRNVTSMYDMFCSCQSLTSLDLSSFNTANVTRMSSMFEGCDNLTDIDLSTFNTSRVTDLNSMFYGCTALKSLDLSSFCTNNVTNLMAMFRGCTNLQTISVSELWNTDNVTSSNNMFKDCAKLVGGEGTTYNANYIDKAYAHIDGGTSDPGYFTYAPYNNNYTPYAVYYWGIGLLVFLNDGDQESHLNIGQTIYALNEADEVPEWLDDGISGQINEVVFDPSFASARPTTTALWFDSMDSLDDIYGLEYLNTSEVTDMTGMFSKCSEITTLDLRTFNTANVTSMAYMFSGCSHLSVLYLDDLNTANVTNMMGMFNNCVELTNLDLSSFNTANVSDMTGMFYNCSDLCEVIVGNGWSTANATESDEMFSGCINLEGGKGTVYDENHVDKEYARIDGGTSNPGYFTAKPNIRGDVNLDGAVDIADAVCVLNAMAGQQVAGDANVNGDYDDNGNPVIDIADLVTVLNIMAGQ